MHIKFCAGGKNKVTRVVNYVIGEKDANGNVRPGVTVLRGDPKSVIEVGSGLSFKTKYSAAIIAFHPKDQPTDNQINELLDQFEKTCFAGLDKKRFSFLAVRHDEVEGGCHLHFVINKVDLVTGKHFNPAPPGWQKVFDPLRDYFNYKYKWARPDDPKRQRYLQPGKMASIVKHVVPEERFTQAHLKEELHDLLMERIIDGQIQNRNEMFLQLKDLNFDIRRKGKNYITVVDRKTKIRTRLKGKLYYEQEYTDEFKRALRATKENKTYRQSSARENNSEKAESCYRQYLERYKSKAKDNLKRYCQKAKDNDEYNESKKRRVSVGEFKVDNSSINIVPSRNRTSNVSVRHKQSTVRESENNSKPVKFASIPDSSNGKQRGYISDTTNTETNDLSIWQSIGNQIIKIAGEKYESIRNRIIKRVGTIVGSIFEGTKRNQQTYKSIESACGQIDECLSKFEKDIKRRMIFINYKRNTRTKKFSI